MIIEIPLGNWLPDAPDLKTGGCIEAKNVYPSDGGYAPFWGAETTGLSVTGTVIGSQRFERTDGTEVICVGTTSDLFVIVSGVVNASSLSLTVPATEAWQFEQYGLQIWATCKTAGMFYLTTIDSDVAFSAPSGTFPKASAIGKVDDFLLAGDLTDIDASDAPYRVRWSPFNNPTGTWTTDLASQSGFVDMPGRFGPVVGISGGDVGLIFQKDGVSRIDYVGGYAAFEKAVISNEIGCESGASVVEIGGVRYWLSRGGFAAARGADVALLSMDKVWDWFLLNANTEQLSKVQGTVNWDRRCIIWNFYGVDLSYYSDQLIYRWESDRWSHSVISADWFTETVYDGAFDEGEVRKRRVLAAFQSGTLKEFTDTPLEAILETGEFQLTPGRRTFTRGVRVLVENVSVNTKAAVGTRNEPGATVSYTSDVAETGGGFSPVAADGRFTRIKVTIPAAANWDKAHGLEADVRPSGVT